MREINTKITDKTGEYKEILKCLWEEISYGYRSEQELSPILRGLREYMSFKTKDDTLYIVISDAYSEKYNNIWTDMTDKIICKTVSDILKEYHKSSSYVFNDFGTRDIKFLIDKF